MNSKYGSVNNPRNDVKTVHISTLGCSKNIYDSENFIDSVSEHFRSIGRFDCIFIKDISTVQRKELYEILVTKGFPKRYLTRLSTTHLK